MSPEWSEKMLCLAVFLVLVVLVFSKDCNVRDFGAKGDCKTLDTKSINLAMADDECKRVILDHGCFLSGSIRLYSQKTLEIQSQAILMGAPQGINAYDHPMYNPWSQYQDFGHNHWKNALIWGINVTEVFINGGGKIDGGSIHTGGPIPDGDADKLIGLQSCNTISISNLYLTNTGHFGVLATNVEHLSLYDLLVRPPRDGFDIVSCRHVKISNCDIQGGGDDALAFKSDFSMGRVIHSYDVRVTNSIVGSRECNGLEIGSETVGDFYDFHFENITVTMAGDSGIGIAIMDGSDSRDISYSRITIMNASTPIQLYIGARGNHPKSVGRNSGSLKNILLEDITAEHCYNSLLSRNITASFDGQPIDLDRGVNIPHPIGPNIILRNVNLEKCAIGGGIEISSPPYFPPHEWNGWYLINQPRPSWGFFMRNVVGVDAKGLKLGWFEKTDDRPAVILQDSKDVLFDQLKVSCRSKELDYDVAVAGGVENLAIKNSPGIVKKNV